MRLSGISKQKALCIENVGDILEKERSLRSQLYRLSLYAPQLGYKSLRMKAFVPSFPRNPTADWNLHVVT